MNIQSKRGTVLGVTMIFVITLTVIALSVLSLAMNSHRLAMRNNMRAESRAVAESELESLYFDFETQVFKGTLPANIPTALSAKVDNGTTPIRTNLLPFLQAHQDAHNWQVGRSVDVSEAFTGAMTGSTKVGSFNNVTVRVSVQPPANGVWGNSGLEMRCGRVMSVSHATIFQVCIFYQGTDLELAPSGTTPIDGPIICNGNIFLASSGAGSRLNLNADVYYLQGKVCNKSSPGLDGVWDDPGDLTPDDVVSFYSPNTPVPGLLLPPVWNNGGVTNQLKTLTVPENLLGGADAVAIQSVNPTLFPTVNDVYRSVIVPPPEAGNTNEYSPAALALQDNPIIKAQRIYNKASLIITIDGATTTIQQVVNGVTTTSTIPTSGVGSPVSPPVNVNDAREAGVTPSRDVAITDIDISKLRNFIGKDTAFDTGFNGVVYVNLKSGTTNSPAAVRLIHADTLPVTRADDGGDNGGFSIATNGGLYIKGDYNTTKVQDITATAVVAPSMLLADGITVLSDAWNDANALGPRSGRVAQSTGTTPNTTIINAGLLTGSVPATTTSFSGGAQNLVRFLEDWYTNEQTVTLNGSFGRLFSPKFFTRPWVDPNGANPYYASPKYRNFSFNKSMVDHPPPGSPQISAVERGRYFFW